MLPLGDLRAVAEIHNDSGCKIIAFQVHLGDTIRANGTSEKWSRPGMPPD